MYIKELRQRKCLSQDQLADKSGLSLRTIQRVESGHRVGFTSLRALAAIFEIGVDTLEQKLYSMDNLVKAYKDFPLWGRILCGSGWYAASRRELQKTEIFFLVMTAFFSTAWTYATVIDGKQILINILAFGFVCSFFGAYNVSITIRVGDKYDIWSRLETTLHKGFFGFAKKRV